MGNPKGAGQLKVILLLSLGLNLFLGGYGIGTFLNRSMYPPVLGPGGPERLQATAERLRGQISPDGMRKIDALIVEIEAMFRSRGPAGGDVRSQLEQVVSENEFDQKKFMGVIDSLSSMRTTSDREVASRISSILSELSLQDRRILANAFLRQLPPRPR